MYSGKFRPAALTVMALLATASLASCSKNNEATGFNPMEGMTDPPKVSTIIMKPQTIKLKETLSGRLEAFRTAEVRARVPGVLQKRLYKEGSIVKEGDKLFVIDDGPYRAILAKAQANFNNSQATLNRMEPLAKKGAVSKQNLDQARMAYQIAKADLDTARINFNYAHVTAPISGRISRALVNEGSLVGQGMSTLLATITQDDPLYVKITKSSQDYLKMKKEIMEGKIEKINDATHVDVILDDGSVYPHKGTLLFTDPTIDQATGQVTLKAEIPNPPILGDESYLMPGMFVNVRMSQTEIKDAYLIPKEAVTRTSITNTIKVVQDDGTFADKNVSIVGEDGQNWIVDKGVNDGDRVLATGFAKINPGVKKVIYTDVKIEDLAKAKKESAAEATKEGSDGKSETKQDEEKAKEEKK